MFVFGPAHIFLSYLLSFAFKKPQNALKFISLIYMGGGFMASFSAKIANLRGDSCGSTWYQISQWFSQLIPLQPMSLGMFDLVQRGHDGFWKTLHQYFSRSNMFGDQKERYSTNYKM